MVNNDSKRYRVELHTWGKNWNGKDYFKTDITKLDDIKEVEDFVKLIDEIYSGITRPDVNESYKYRKKAPKYCKSNEENYIYDENHFWWGYAVLDYKNEKVIMQGGVGLYDFWNPMKSLAILDRYFRKEGEVPKDGPSAGITITTALASLLTNKKVSGNIAMTGEVSLRGNVMPIGGLKEKLMAAERAGVKKAFIPKDNIDDLKDIPEEIKEKIEVIPVTTVKEVLKELKLIN